MLQIAKIKKISVKPQRPFCGFTSICIVSHLILQFIRWRAIQLLPYFAAYNTAAGFFTTFSIFTITELRRMFVTDSTTKFSPTIPKIR